MADAGEAPGDRGAEGRLKAELAALAALAAEPLSERELAARLTMAGVADADAQVAALHAKGFVEDGSLTPVGIRRLLTLHAEIEASLDPSPTSADREECPSIPWLTTVTTEWIEALSFNYAVDEAALGALLPPPLMPEVFKGTAWVQVLISSLREMRPQGAPRLFGQNFYQVSYRAAVQYAAHDGSTRRGGYFVRSETSDPVMREVGNALAEFRFHEFGLADIVMLRDGPRLTLGVDPREGPGKLVAVVDTTPHETPPANSVWRSLDELQEPLVECYDALGVEAAEGWMYVLTIDREPWRARFVQPEHVFCEWMENGPMAGRACLDSVLHIPRCAYRWRPLRRERLG